MLGCSSAIVIAVPFVAGGHGIGKALLVQTVSCILGADLDLFQILFIGMPREEIQRTVVFLNEFKEFIKEFYKIFMSRRTVSAASVTAGYGVEATTCESSYLEMGESLFQML